MEELDHVAGAEGWVGGRAQEQAGAVVEEVEDLDRAAVGELPGSRVDLPGLIRQLGLEADERTLRPLVRLRGDQALALENPPDRGHRGQGLNALGEVVLEGLRTGVVAGCGQLLAELKDRRLDLSRGLV
jgi:hypothetical protein